MVVHLFFVKLVIGLPWV